MLLRPDRPKQSSAGGLKNFAPLVDPRRKVLSLQAARQAQADNTNHIQLLEYCPVSHVPHSKGEFQASEQDRQLPVSKQASREVLVCKDYVGNVSEVQLG